MILLDATPVRVWNQVTRTSDVTSIREVIHFFVDFAADRELFAHAVAMVVDVLKTSIAREEAHVFRDCVDNQPCLAQDMMEKMAAPNTQPVGEGTQNTVDCMVDQVFFAHTVMVVDLLIIRLTR